MYSIRTGCRSPSGVAILWCAVHLLAAAPVGSALELSSWTATGPAQGTNVSAMAMAHSMPARLYMAPFKAPVYRTDNRGESWRMAATGLPCDGDVNCLAVSPENPDLVLAGLSSPWKIYGTTDGGGVWTSSSSGISSGDVVAIAFDPIAPETVLAGVIEGVRPGVYRSEDAGHSWTASSTSIGEPEEMSLSFNPGSPNEAVMAIRGGTVEGIHRTTDGGRSWLLVSPGPYRSVSWSAPDPSKVYAVHSTEGVFRSDDSGLSFSPVGPSALLESMKVVRAHPTNPDRVWLGGNEFYWNVGNGSVFSFAWPSLLHSFNMGAEWHTVYKAEIWGGIGNNKYGDVSEILVDPTDSSYVFFGVSNSVEDVAWSDSTYEYGGLGIHRSDSGGAIGTFDWIPKNDGIPSDQTLHVACDLEGSIFLRSWEGLWGAANPAGPFTSHEVSQPGMHATSIAGFLVNLTDPSRLYEVGYWWDIDDGGAYYQWTMLGSWFWWPDYPYLPDGLPDGHGQRAFVNHGSGRVFYVWAEDHLYRTEDSGGTFTRMSKAFAVVEAVIDPADEYHLFAATADSHAVLVSEDGGESWVPCSTGLPDGVPVTLVMDRGDADHLLVVFALAGPYVTTDAGTSWSSVSCDLGGAEVVDADWDPKEGRVFLATRHDGIYVTGLGLANQGLPTRDLLSLSYSIPHETLVVGTKRLGAFARHFPRSVAVCVPDGDSQDERPVHGEFSVGPNPFSPEAVIRFTVPASGAYVHLDVADVRGGRIRTLLDGWRPGGLVLTSWDGRAAGGDAVAAGVYFLRLRVGDDVTTRRIVHIR
jgi:photosystem II stability/assembly factor-like uncharacterized protein